MARIFVGDYSNYILLEQHCSKGCQRLLDVPPSILVPAVTSVSEEVKLPSREIPEEEGEVKISEGRAAKILAYLRVVKPDLNPEKVKFRVQINKHLVHDFDVDWNYLGSYFRVFSEKGVRQKLSTAVKEVVGKSLPDVPDFSLRVGTFVDYSQDSQMEITSYKEVDHHLWLTKGKVEIPEFMDPKGRDYFALPDAHKEKKILDNILNRGELWKVFVEKKQMTVGEFKRLSCFGPKAIAGFFHFLINNRIAIRSGNIFVLNEAVIPEIKKLLQRSGMK